LLSCSVVLCGAGAVIDAAQDQRHGGDRFRGHGRQGGDHPFPVPVRLRIDVEFAGFLIIIAAFGVILW
jgi:hypothetical protein